MHPSFTRRSSYMLFLISGGRRVKYLNSDIMTVVFRRWWTGKMSSSFLVTPVSREVSGARAYQRLQQGCCDYGFLKWFMRSKEAVLSWISA
jgi:hypothetical protein